MGFSQEWEQRYADNTHLSIWPWSDIVSLVHRHCKPLIAQGGASIGTWLWCWGQYPFISVTRYGLLRN